MPIHPIIDFMFGEWGGGGQTIDFSGNGIPSAEAFGTAQLNQNIQASGIASAEAFGTAILSIEEEIRGGRRLYDFELERKRRIEKQNQEIMIFVTSFMKVVNE